MTPSSSHVKFKSCHVVLLSVDNQIEGDNKTGVGRLGEARGEARGEETRQTMIQQLNAKLLYKPQRG